MNNIKVAVTYNAEVGGTSVVALKHSFVDVGCDILDADYRDMMQDIPQEEFDEAYKTLDGRKKLFAHAKSQARKILQHVDCLAFSGNSAMIDPVLFNQSQVVGDRYDFSRTIAELALVHVATQKGLPIMAVCGGHQVVAVYNGGTVKNLPSSDFAQQMDMNYDAITLNADSMLGRILEPKAYSATHLKEEFFGSHYQIVNTIGSGFIKTGVASDEQSIEATESEYGAPIITTQFHPEVALHGLPGLYFISAFLYKKTPTSESCRRIFEFFRDAGEVYRHKKSITQEELIEGKKKLSTVDANKRTTIKSKIHTQNKQSNFIVKALMRLFKDVSFFFNYIVDMIKQVIRNIISYFVTLTNVKKLKKRESPPCDDIHEQRGDSFNQSGEHSPKPAEIMSHVPAAMWATPSMRNKRVKKQATMKTWIAGDSHLAALYEGIQKYTGFNTTGLVNHETRSTQINLSDVKINAVKKIQHAWRGYKVKELFVNDPYGSYVSMIHPDDEQRLLSSIMFGRHEAEFGINAKDRIANPYIEGSASYHRCDKFSGKLLEQLKIEFKITNKMLEGKIILPLTKLNTVSMDDLIKQSGARGVKVISDPNHSISFVLFDSPNENLRWFFVSSGLIASPWEIAQNVTGLANSNDAAEASLSNDTAYMRGLPKTKDELLQSDLFLKLERIAQRKDCPTHPLASSLVQLLNNDDVLTSAAITRIALIIDMANTFYAKNYPRYAFCVYTIIHELSLSIALQDDPAQLDMGFKRFINESKDTLFNSLGLDETQLGKSTFIASPALSGTNAYMIAKRIASVMASKSGKNPTIATYGPRYFELKSQEFEYPWFSDPDIVLISTGPIVNMGGLTPGVDLNGFIRDKMIKQGRTKPLTLIVDTTTALYKSLHLDEDVKKLVTDGKLSIIVCESHQKFGLLHSDQAQYGRVFGVCATDSDRSKISKLQQIQTDAQLDFNQHMDMRVGANISYCCKDILEKIKQQHFSNGALFNNILNQANLISHHIVNHKYMSKKLDELYFVMPACSWQDFAGVVTTRASFGHYSTTLSFVGSLARLCANASDDIDSLITSSQIYLALTSRNQRKRNKGIEEVVKKNSTNMKELVQAEQVISLALTLNMINSTLYTQPERFIEQIERYCVLKNVLSACESLKGRHSYNDVSQYFYSLKKQIIAKIKIMGGNAATFLKVALILHNHNVPLSDEILPILSLNGITCRYILRMSDSILLNNDSIHDLTHNPDAVANILNHTNFLDDHAELFKVLRSSGIYFDVKTLEALLTNQPTLVALSQLLNHKISLDSDTIKMLGKPEFVEFISSNTPLTQEMFNALAMLNSADLNIDEMTRDVTNKNDRFFELMSLVYNGNAGVLTHLKEKDGGYKYHQALRYTPIYLKECSLAIKAFCAKSPSLKNNNRLIRSINQANEKYCSKVLSLERGDFVSSIAKAMFNNILVGLIAILTLGIAAAVLPISKYRFFTTTSEKKLTNIEAELGHSLAKNTPKNGRM